jgi:hypothetical protein
VLLEELDQLKNPMASWGIKPAAFQLVAQCLNQLSYRAKLTSGYDKMSCMKKHPRDRKTTN